VTQLPLLTVEVEPSPWVRLSEPGDKLRALWFHRPSRWRVRHCGHPTANWPYYAESPEFPEMVVTHNGRGWRTAELARAALDEVMAGTAVVTADRCVAGVRRVLRPGED
jgi:hypothetical protein